MILLLCSDGKSTTAVYNRLESEFPGEVKVIMEDDQSRWSFIKIRLKKVGILHLISQLAFVFFCVPLLKRSARKRSEQIALQYALDFTPIPPSKIIKVQSVNAQECVDAILRENPKLIVLNGTRIIAARVLSQIQCPVLNTHVGITPLYRGCHGGYWALYSNDPENCGVTIHMVDAGINTGAVLEQARIMPNTDDNFMTYPLLQLGAALPLLMKQVRLGLSGRLTPLPYSGDSHVWYHPGIFQYLIGRMRGVY